MTHILTSLLKAHNIRKVVAGPQENAFITSINHDAFFDVYESGDERSAGYIACGMAAELCEPVVLVCSGLSAFKNCMPPLTEAFYRQLPVLALTVEPSSGDSCTVPISWTSIPRDCAKFRLHVPVLDTPELAHEYTVKLNEALLELTHNGDGPVHVDIEDFCASELPNVQVIERIDSCDAVVLCTITSGYKGKYGVNAALSSCREMDLMIHIGRPEPEDFSLKPREVWRVHPDGAVHDVFGKLRYVFEMMEEDFFSRYASPEHGVNTEYYSACRKDCASVPNLPFSGVWVAQNITSCLPPESAMHLSSDWSSICVDLPETVTACSSTSLDGNVSALLGASLASPGRLFFGVFEASEFFRNMNAAGSRHRGPNLRIMVISRKGEHQQALLKDYASDLGFEYLCASDKEEYAKCLSRFTAAEIGDRPVFFEVFTDAQDEEQARSVLRHASGGIDR